QATTHIDMGHIEAHVPELDVIAPNLFQSRLHVTDVGDLAAQVEVDQFENVLPVQPIEPVQQLHQLNRVEAELGALSPALGPAARPLGGELDPDTGRGHHVHFV